MSIPKDVCLSTGITYDGFNPKIFYIRLRVFLFCFVLFFSTLWMSQRRLLYVMVVSNTSFCTWMSLRRLLNVMNVSKTSSVCYGCLKYVFCTLWMSQRRLSYVRCFKYVSGTTIYLLGRERSQQFDEYFLFSLVLYIFRTEYNFKRKRNS